MGEWDGGGVMTNQYLLTPRITQQDVPSGLSGHATHVAGTIMATSGYGGAYTGGAYQANLNAYDWNNDNSEMSTAAAGGLLVSNSSYGYIRGWYFNSVWYWYGDTTISTTEDYKFGFYDVNTQALDQIAVNAPYYLIVRSAGNDRDDDGPTPGSLHKVWGGTGWINAWTARDTDGEYDCIGQRKVAKNVLTVGAVNDIPGGYTQPSDVVIAGFSSWGPADDGRIKPDIVANGVSLTSSYWYSADPTNPNYTATMSGTSMSTPSVSGSCILLQEHYQDLNSGSSMLSATLKGLVIHTADEASTSAGPDYQFGWGLMNTESAANQITGADTVDNMLQELSLSNGEVDSFQVYSEGTDSMWATLCWTDPAGTPVSASLDPTDKMLVNDLDLRIENGSVYQPWILDGSNPSNAAITGDNNTDNVEQVVVGIPSAGYCTIKVNHKGTLQGGSQQYSLFVSGALDVVATPVLDPPGGSYGSPQEVTVSTSTVNATMYYTTDGTDPDETDPVVTSDDTISVSENTTLKVKAYKDDMGPSMVSTGVYDLGYWIETHSVSSTGSYTFNDDGDGHEVVVEFTGLTGSDDVTIRQNTNPPNDVPGTNVCDFNCEITAGGGISDFTVNVTFYYTNGDASGYTESSGYFGLGKFNGSTNTWVWLGGTVNAGVNTVTVSGVSSFSTFALFRRIFGDCTGDGYVDAADLQRLGDCWHETNTGEFSGGTDARFFNTNKNTDAGDQIIDAGDLQVFGDCWHNGIP